jgi:hypothetical protein
MPGNFIFFQALILGANLIFSVSMLSFGAAAWRSGTRQSKTQRTD